jgi:hypothetical protein
MNDRVRRVHCSNGFCKFDSYTTTKIINMNKEEMEEVVNKYYCDIEID